MGEFAELGGRGGSGDETFGFEVRLRWEKVLAEGGWTGLGWPVEWGGRGATITEQVIFHEECARASAPGRVSVVGEGLLAPTLIHYGTEEQKQRFLPPIRSGTELWCQGYSEPDAGSDLANVKTRATLDGDQWTVSGQKVWTSLAHQSDWCFVVCRTDPDARRHRGLSYLLVPMDQPGVEVRPIVQLTKTSEFNEVFFDGARTHRDNVVGEVGDGWRVALATLAFERGVALLGHQLGFARQLDDIIARARQNGRSRDPVLRQRLARAHAELAIMRYNTLRSLPGSDGPVRLPRRPPSPSCTGVAGIAGWASSPSACWGRRPPCSIRAATSSTSSSGCSCSPDPKPFTVAPTRSSATSLASGCSVSRPSRRGPREPRGCIRSA